MFAVLLGQSEKMLHEIESNLVVAQMSKTVGSSFLTSDDITLDSDQVLSLQREFYELAEQTDDNTLILYHMGQLAYWSGDYENVIGSLRAPLQNRQFPLASFLLGSAFWELNKNMDAKSSWRTADNIETFFLIQASQAEHERNYHVAEESFKKLLVISPGSPEARSGYLFVHSMNLLSNSSSDPSEIDEVVGQALSQNKESVSRQLRLGSALYQARKLKLAEKALHQAIRLEPRSHWSKYYLGLVYFVEKDYFRAEELLMETVEIAPDFARGHHWLARTMVNLGKNDLALLHYRLALSLLPDDNALVTEAESFFEKIKDTK
jgi:tetratricopeptide (TPR) repeat protein